MNNKLHKAGVWLMYWGTAALVLVIGGVAVFIAITFYASHYSAQPIRTSTAPSAPAAIAVPAPSASNTEKDKEIEAMRKRMAEIEAKLAAAQGKDTPPSTSMSQSVTDAISSFFHTKVSPPPSIVSVPAATLPPAPKAPSVTPEHRKSPLDETIAKIQEKIAGKGTESTSAPTTALVPTLAPPPKVVPAPVTKPEAKPIEVKTIPTPPAVTPAVLKGPSTGGFLGGIFSRACSTRSEEVDLSTVKDNGGWLQLTTGKCDVVYWYNVKAIILAKDEGGEFFLQPGTTSRVPKEVKLVAGDSRFVYSTCSKVAPGTKLGFDCNPMQ